MIVVVGILAAIASPVWLRFLANQRASVAQGLLKQGIQEAQLKSQQNNTYWQFSVRKNEGAVETAVHPQSTDPALSTWNALDGSLDLDDETTLLSSSGVHYVRFDVKGNVRRSSLGRVTISSKQFPDIKRCVIVSTLIGATRTAREQPVPDPTYNTRDRFCY